MSVNTKHIFLNDGRVVRGIKVTEKNYGAVSEWLKDAGDALFSEKEGKSAFNHRVRVKTKKGIRVAKIGDFVIKNVDGSVWVAKAAEFDRYVKP